MNSLTPQMLAQIFAQESTDPFLILLTLDHETFTEPIYLVNNSVNIVSRGTTFVTFPFRVRLPIDDGESNRDLTIDFDNVSLELIAGIRTATTPVSVKLEMILASMPDVIQMSVEELEIQSLSYNATVISAKLYLDTFLNTGMTSESYQPHNFPGIF